MNWLIGIVWIFLIGWFTVSHWEVTAPVLVAVAISVWANRFIDDLRMAPARRIALKVRDGRELSKSDEDWWSKHTNWVAGELSHVERHPFYLRLHEQFKKCTCGHRKDSHDRGGVRICDGDFSQTWCWCEGFREIAQKEH